MRISRFLKSITYAVTASALLITAIMIHNNFHARYNLNAYFKMDIAFFAMGCIFVGTAIYSYRNYSKTNREHLVDSIYLGAFGLFYLIVAFLVFFAFGGIKEETLYTAGIFPVNLKLILISLSAIPFLVRSAMLAFSPDNSKRQKTIAFLVIGVIIVLYIIMFFTGNVMKMVRSND